MFKNSEEISTYIVNSIPLHIALSKCSDSKKDGVYGVQYRGEGFDSGRHKLRLLRVCAL